MLPLQFHRILIVMLGIGLLTGCQPTTSEPSQTIVATEEITTLQATLATAPPTLTPTLVLTAPLITPSDTPTPTNTPYAVIGQPEDDIPSHLFLFSTLAGFEYNSLDPVTGLNFLDINDSSKLGVMPTLDTSTTIAFAHKTNQLAVWVRNASEHGTLWITDITLKEPKPVYVDEEQRFTSNAHYPPRDVTLEWFVNDQYVLIESFDQDVDPVLVNITTLAHEKWSWLCNAIVVSPRTSNLALLCTHDNEFLVTEWNGNYWSVTDETLSPIVQQAQAIKIWQWSPSGSHIAYVPSDTPNVVEIVNSQGEVLSIPLNADTVLDADTIRWTMDEKVLIKGYREAWPADWYILDSKVGEVIWSLEQTREFNLTVEQQSEWRLLKGDISFDGRYIILATNRLDMPSGNQLLLIDVKNNRFEGAVVDVGHGLDNFAWGH